MAVSSAVAKQTFRERKRGPNRLLVEEATNDPYLYTDGLEGLFQLPEEISESVKIPKHDIKPLPETRTGRKIKKPSYLEDFINK